MFLLGLLELIVLGVFFLLMIIGAAFDRNGFSESFKWWVFLAGIVGAFFFLPVGWTFASLWESVKSADFWQPVGIYLALGLGYSLIEFALAVRRIARQLGEKWQEYLNSKWPKSSGSTSTFEKVRFILQDESRKQEAADLVERFVSSANSRGELVMISKVEGLNIEPKVNRAELAENITVWTLFWPFYAVSLIIGDLLTEVFRTIADFLATMSQRAVKAIFADTFKIS